MKNRLTKILFVLVIVLLTYCSRSSDVLGPDACPSDKFAITAPLSVTNNADASTTELNLSSSYAKVSFSFNEMISYKFSIKGENSGAEFIMESSGNSIDTSWYGSSTNGKYFEKGEMLHYTLTNICKSEALGVGQIHLATIIGYNGFGLKVANFEEGTIPGAMYGDLLSTGTCGASALMSSGADYIPSPQGGSYYMFKATCTSSTDPNGSWYFGGKDFEGIDYSKLGTDPTRIYLNFFAKGQDNSQAQMIFKESVYGTSLTRKFLADVSPEGWALYSVKLSDIGVIDPSKITALSFNLGASKYQDFSAQADLDLLIFTFDKPF